MLRTVAAEFVGTFVLVLVGCGALVAQQTRGAPDATGVALSFGLVVAAMVATFGGISGAHLNPAVTVAAAVTGRFPWDRVPAYVGAQCAGAMVAAGMLRVVAGGALVAGVTSPSVSWPRALLVEVVITFVLMVVIAAVSGDRRVGSPGAGAVIGATVALAALWAGPFTGASMNPARSLGPALVSGHPAGLWLYLLGPVVGATLGALTYDALRGVAPVATQGAGVAPTVAWVAERQESAGTVVRPVRTAPAAGRDTAAGTRSGSAAPSHGAYSESLSTVRGSGRPDS
jgi:MIP family channel proteins